MPSYTLASTTGGNYVSWWGYFSNCSSQVNLPNVNITGALNITPTYKYPCLVISLTLRFDQYSASSLVYYALGYTAGAQTAKSGSVNPTTTPTSYTRTITTPSGGWETWTDRNFYYGFYTNGYSSYFGKADAGQAGEYALNNVYQVNQSTGVVNTAYTGVALIGSIDIDIIPSAPTVSFVSNTANSIKISWTVPADDGGTAITYYRVAYKKTSDTTWLWATTQIATATLEYTITGLTYNTSYDIAVSAINNVCDRHNNTTAPTGYNTLTYTTGTNGLLTQTTASGFVKMYDGTNWVSATVKQYDVTTWIPATVKKYDGTSWTI